MRADGPIFTRDDEQHWVAQLACGHTQHLRHNPPWQDRAWVLDEETRKARIGMTLNCVKCDAPDPAANGP
jgi:hypothetical protein